jgi:hypothetical protein
MARRTNRLGFERLESRELLSGNGVTASIVRINNIPELFITEALGQGGGTNAVQVSRLANGLVRVSGQVSSDGTLTHVNGRLFQDFTLAPNRDLVVDLGAGADQLQVVNARFGNVFVGMDRPVPSPDADTVTLSGLKTFGRVSIGTGDGQDGVFVRNSIIGDGVKDSQGHTDDLDINTGAGADLVEVGQIGGAFVQVKGNLIVNTFRSLAEQDFDSLKVNQTFVDQSMFLDTGGGDDRIGMVDVSAGADIVLVAGEGNDGAALQEVSARGSFFIGMASGNDNVDMTFLQAGTLLQVDGGTGFDRLEHHLDASNPHTQFLGWEVINGLSTTVNLGNLSGLTFTRA